MTTRSYAAALALLTAAAACSDSTGPAGHQNVALSFRVSEAPAAPTQAPGGPARTVDVDGSNGSLTLERIRVIVNDAKLKPADGSCDAVTTTDPTDDCPDFEAPPRFLDLPLDGTPVQALVAPIPAGSYKELDFEIEDLEDDEEDPAMAAAIQQLRQEILAQVSDWPDKASVLVEGTFQPAGGGAAESFRVFVDAEIEVEFALVPQLEIRDDGSASRTLTVDVRPDIWFGQSDGTVRDLRQWDFQATQQLLELEVEMEEGFTEIEIGS